MPDGVVLSLGDALIRESDMEILSGPYWLNDRIIGFYFEYLHLHKFESASGVCFISPEVSQFLKLSHFQEIPIFLDPLELDKKDVILLAVNNASDPSVPGGSHWSLLIYASQAQEFFHFDSSPGMNESDARLLSKKVHEYLTQKSGRFKFSLSEVPVLKQTNGYDCGVHLLCNAEHATRHFWMFGSAQGLKEVDPNVVKKKRNEVRKIILSLAGRDSSSSST